MPLMKRGSRRLVGAGIGALAAGTASAQETPSSVLPKQPGETKVVCVMGGDYGHNAIFPEMHIRTLFDGLRGWRIIFVQASRFFSPELIADADLLITSRHSRPDDIGFRTVGLVESMEPGALLWSDDNVRAIVENIRSRGMGFLAVHNTIACGNPEMMNLLGVTYIPHNEVQPLWLHEFAPDHPITTGMDKVFLPLDEQFGAIIKSEYTTMLFESTGIHDKRRVVGGWCRDDGKGRVVGLLPGHTADTYRVPAFQQLLWRSAFWAMKRPIPPYPGPRSVRG